MEHALGEQDGEPVHGAGLPVSPWQGERRHIRARPLRESAREADHPFAQVGLPAPFRIRVVQCRNRRGGIEAQLIVGPAEAAHERGRAAHDPRLTVRYLDDVARIHRFGSLVGRDAPQIGEERSARHGKEKPIQPGMLAAKPETGGTRHDQTCSEHSGGLEISRMLLPGEFRCAALEIVEVLARVAGEVRGEREAGPHLLGGLARDRAVHLVEDRAPGIGEHQPDLAHRLLRARGKDLRLEEVEWPPGVERLHLPEAQLFQGVGDERVAGQQNGGIAREDRERFDVEMIRVPVRDHHEVRRRQSREVDAPLRPGRHRAALEGIAQHRIDEERNLAGLDVQTCVTDQRDPHGRPSAVDRPTLPWVGRRGALSPLRLT